MANLPVIAVIPAYNAAGTLPGLLTELVSQKYDGIFVIDDASADDTVKVAKSFDGIKVIVGKTNVGSGANRNRIIGMVPECYIHFLDADVKLVSKNTPEIIRQLAWKENTAYFGGRLNNPDGSQNPYNFGPRASLTTSVTSFLQYGIWILGNRNRKAAKSLRKFFSLLLRSWPDIYQSPTSRQVFWTAESNLIIRSQLFEDLGGFDPMFRYAEINDLAIRLERTGYKAYFAPKIEVVHASVDNIFLHTHDKRHALVQLIKKYGWLSYIAPRLTKIL